MVGSGEVLILGASELLTLAGPKGPRRRGAMGDLGVVAGGGLYAKDGIIQDVGTSQEVKARHLGVDRIIDAAGQVVMPGFVDPHTHLLFAGSREKELEWRVQGLTYEQIVQRGGGIQATVEATRRASLEQLVAIGRKRLDLLMGLGTTTVEVKSGYGLRTEDEVKMLEALRRLDVDHPLDVVPTFMGAHAVPPEFALHRHGYLRYVVEEMLPRVGLNLALFCDIFVEVGYFSVDEGRELLTEARKFGLEPKVHADELTNLGGATLAAQVGATSADHLLHVDREGIKALANSNTLAVLLPGTPLGSPNLPFPPARMLIDSGVPVALGTDLNPNAWMESMPLVISIACHRMAMTPEEAITAATINAAHAVGRGHQVGSLEVGKRADVIGLGLDNYLQIPYRMGANHIEWVVKDGTQSVAHSHGGES